jgi:hypothetical protein
MVGFNNGLQADKAVDGIVASQINADLTASFGDFTKRKFCAIGDEIVKNRQK